ncbi:hypothetical protein [Pseudomonas japonica]|uniref:hypothetical protein n=1 Tax=Pseudomonas japonica TaxID=256466 RepID=UPI0015E35633|nr:hypothetical protein [Pseudomonas japonica]MBA1245434.1 hypothetical protein [Pseudomonas japonica]
MGKFARRQRSIGGTAFGCGSSIGAGLANATILAGWGFIFAGGGATAQVRQEKFLIAGMQRIQLHGLRQDKLQTVMPFLLLQDRYRQALVKAFNNTHSILTGQLLLAGIHKIPDALLVQDIRIAHVLLKTMSLIG